MWRKNILIEIILACVIFTLIDSVWIGLVMKNHYEKVIQDIQKEPMDPNFLAAGLCYICLVGGLYYFVIYRVKEFNILTILSLAVPYGLATYGTYDFTTSAILKNWDLGTAFMDVAWGIVLNTLTSVSVLYYRFNFGQNDEIYEENRKD